MTGRTCTCPNGPMPGHYIGCPLAGNFGLPRPTEPRTRLTPSEFMEPLDATIRAAIEEYERDPVPHLDHGDLADFIAARLLEDS